MRILSILVLFAATHSASAQKPEAKYRGKPLAYWLDQLENTTSPKEIAPACQALQAFPDGASRALPILVGKLDDLSEEYRQAVAWGFLVLEPGPRGKPALPTLIKMLKEDKPRLDPLLIMQMLCAIGPDAKEAIPVIRPILLGLVKQGETPVLSSLSFSGLNKLGSDITPTLLEMIDISADGKRCAIEIIMEMGKDAKQAAPRLLKLLDDSDLDVRLNASIALWKIEKNPLALTALVALIEDRDITWDAAVNLSEMDLGPAAKSELPKIKAALAKKYPGYVSEDVEKAWREYLRKAIRNIEAAPKK